MHNLNFNILSAIILFIILSYIIKGIFYKFQRESLTFAMISAVNNLLFFVAVIFSLYIARGIVFDADSSFFRWIKSYIPKDILTSIKGFGILAYILIMPPLVIIFMFILESMRRIFDRFIERAAYNITDFANKSGKAARALMGIIIQIPKMFIAVFTTMLLIQLINMYYPVRAFSEQIESSRVYNYLYSNAVTPILESKLFKKVPEFLYSSNDISGGLNNTNAVQKRSIISDLENIRFQIESRSNDEIDKTAKTIVGSETDDYKKAYLIYKWVGKNIDYDWDKYNDILNNESYKDKFGAIHTFNTKKGVCEDYSDLYAAMARAVGLKVRIIVGQAFDGSNWTGHAWNEVYISKEKKWIPLDTTWAKAGDFFNNKNFYKTHVSEGIAYEW